MKKKNSGISAVPLIIALVFMISLGAFFNSMMLGKHAGAPLLAQTTKALYIAEAGIEYTDEYLLGYVDWTTVPDISSTTFGGGTFAVTFTNNTQYTVTATTIGTIANAVRVITIDFKRTSLLGLNSSPESYPVSYLSGGITDQGAIILCQDGNPCGPPPATCSCSHLTTSEDAPSPIPPLPPDAPPLPWPNWSIPSDQPWNYNFAPGTYYFDTLTLTKVGGNDANVTVSGPVTIWIWTKFEMKNAATFNYLPTSYTNPDNPANVLLLSASSSAAFVLMNTAKFSGGIYAPNGTVELKNSAQIVGAIVGNNVKLRNTSGVTSDSTAGGSAQGYTQTVTIAATSWREM